MYVSSEWTRKEKRGGGWKRGKEEERYICMYLCLK
jgi:hypothetical protein